MSPRRPYTVQALSESALAIEALLKLQDKLFVTAAYQAIFGRDPDPGGLDNYVARVRAGDDKTRILTELAQSPEGRISLRERPGLSEAIARCRTSAPSLLSRVCRRIFGATTESGERNLRIIDNRLYLAEQGVAQQEEQLAELRTLVLQMLWNAGSSDPAYVMSDHLETVHVPRIWHPSPNLARTFAELKTAIAMKRMK
jgi:hypothetical protein